MSRFYGFKDIKRTIEELYIEYKKNLLPNDEEVGISRRADIALKMLENVEDWRKDRNEHVEGASCS